MNQKKILVLGAGRSASTLIQYLLDHAAAENWLVTVGDFSPELAEKKITEPKFGKAIFFDVKDEANREKLIAEHDLVVSLLPVEFHPLVARDCVRLKTHLVTASYVSTDMSALDASAKEAGVILLNELGVDPGIDHLSAMQKIDEIRNAGGKITSFKSYCGALIAPEFNNIWGYKFTWAPRNVILAGQGTAKYLKNNHITYIPYNRLFLQTEAIEVPGVGSFEAYANRDSLNYTGPYGLEEVPTLLRGTLRVKGFCKAWNAFVRIGLTDDTYKIKNSAPLTWKDFLFSYIDLIPGKTHAESIAAFLGENADSEVMKKLLWLNISGDEKTGVENGSPAQILLHLLEKKWLFEEGDRDMIVMQHQFEYELEGKKKKAISSMMVKGKDHTLTAISNTVGLPAAIGAKLILQGKIHRKGVLLPVTADLYDPILHELEGFGIRFHHEEFSL